MYSGPRWETNATPSAEFQHQLTDTGTPEKQEEAVRLYRLCAETNVDDPATFSVVESRHRLFLCYVPHDEEVIGRG